MSKNHLRFLIVCLLSVFEDCSDAFISKRRTFAPSSESVNFRRSRYNPYASSAEQTASPPLAGPRQDAALASTNENPRHHIPSYLYKDFHPRAHQSDTPQRHPQEQGASHSRRNLQTSFVHGSPNNVQGLYGFTGTSQTKALGEPSRPDDLSRPPASMWDQPSQYGSARKERPSVAGLDQSVNGYQFKTKTIDEDLERVVQPVYGAALTHQRFRSDLDVYPPGVSSGDDASRSEPSNFPPSAQHRPPETPSPYSHMQASVSYSSVTDGDNSPSVDIPASSSSMNPQAGTRYKMPPSSYNHGVPFSQEESLSRPSQPKVPGVLNHGFRSRFPPVARRYSFGASDVASSVPSPDFSPSPGGEPGVREPLPGRFAMHPWESHTRDAARGSERSALTAFQRDKTAAELKAGRLADVIVPHGVQGTDPQPHRSWLVPAVDYVQPSHGATEESVRPSQTKSIPEKHFGNTIYEYPSVFKKYGFGQNRATYPSPLRSHFKKMERLNELSRNKDATIQQSNQYDVRLSTHPAVMPSLYSSSPKEYPSIASTDQSVNTNHPFLLSGIQPESSSTRAPPALGFVNPRAPTGDDASKFPPPASLVKTEPVVAYENAYNPRVFVTPSSGSSASRQREDAVEYQTEPTSLPYGENVSHGLGTTPTRHISDKPGSMPIEQPISHTRVSPPTSPVLDQSTSDPTSNSDVFSQREAALGIYRPRGKKPNKSGVRGLQIPPKSINSILASQTGSDPNAQSAATATGLGTPIDTSTNAPLASWGLQPGPEAAVASLGSLTPPNQSLVLEKPATQSAAANPTLYDILYKKPTSSIVKGKLVRGKLPVAQNRNTSFTFIKTHFPPVVGSNKHINSKPIQFADIAGSASFSSITSDKRPRAGEPLTRMSSTTDAKATANQDGHAQIPAPIRRDLSSGGTFFSVGGGGPRGAPVVPRQEGRVDPRGDGSD